jgi:hypothetical protein
MVRDHVLDVLDALTRHPFRRDHAVASGIPDTTLAELTASGLLARPLRGVLVRADAADDLRTRAAALRLVLPEGAAICRGSAAWLHDVDARPWGAHTREPPLECAVPRGRAIVRRPGIRCYVTDLTPDDVTEVSGLPCTTPARTAIDLARWSVPGLGLGALDAMARRGLVEPADLLPMTARWSGDRYMARARRLIGLCDPAAESVGESCLRLRFHDAGFPPPEVQIPLADADGVERRRLDLGYRAHRYAWEYDGEEFHSGRRAEAADRARRAEIERQWGWTVVGVGKNLVLGPSMTLELAVGEIIGMRPLIRRRLW